MSVEARLLALVQNYRAQYGDHALTAGPQLVANLSSQAPDLYGEIRALAAAVSRGAAARIGASPDPEGEAGRIATEIAGAEKLSMAAATAGVAVARGLGGAPAPAAPAAPPAAAGGWAGESVAVQPQPAPPGYPPQAPAPGYAPQQAAPGYLPPGSAPLPGQPVGQPIYKNPVVLGLVGLLGAFLIYQQFIAEPGSSPTNTTGNETGPSGPLAGPSAGPLADPNSRPQAGPDSGPAADDQGQGPEGGQTAGNLPFLQRPGSGALPTLPLLRGDNNVPYVNFMLRSRTNGEVEGAVAVSPQGWTAGPTVVAFGQPGAQQASNVGRAQMRLVRGQGVMNRVGVVTWQQDGYNIGPMCVGFQSAGSTGDVEMAGSTMCLMEADCQRPVVCGRVAR